MPATDHGHQHGEAFAVMLYAPDDGSEGEYVWNSRDGVTPFIIGLKDGREATHTNWSMDRYYPDYDPPDGSRVFVDQSPEMAVAHAEEMVERYWEGVPGHLPPMSELFASREGAVAALAGEHQPGAPALITAEEYKQRVQDGTLYLVSPIPPQLPPNFRGSPAGTDRFA